MTNTQAIYCESNMTYLRLIVAMASLMGLASQSQAQGTIEFSKAPIVYPYVTAKGVVFD
jgi:hypothetical protein